MKAILRIYFFITFLTATAFGQTAKEEIIKTYVNYFKAIKQNDYEKSFDYIYPKLFDLFPKELFLQALIPMKIDTNVRTTIDNDSITNISEVIEMDGKKFAILSYSFIMTMQIKNNKNTIDSLTSVDSIYENIKKKFGANNVKFYSKNNVYKVNRFSKMYVINDPLYDGWKFLEKTEEMDTFLGELLLPKTILERFK